MKAQLRKAWEQLLSNYWFFPSLLAIGAMLLAGVTITFDQWLQADGLPEWAQGIPFPFHIRPDAARSLLSTIAGTMITVGGLTFSITISAVVYASSSYGPRLLGRFMRDRGNQLTLGVYIATFLFSLLVLLSVENYGSVEGTGLPSYVAGGFVPHIGVLVAVLLTLINIGVLIFFLNHAPQSIHVSTVIGELGAQLQRRIGKAFPYAHGEASPAVAGRDDARRALIEGRIQGGWPIRAKSSGFLQVVETDSLIAAARRANLVLRLDYRPGDYVSDGDTLLYACPAEPLEGEDRERSTKEVLDCFAFGKGRTVNQDVRLPVDQLVEVAVRALSPGINDPFTANDCMDALGRGMHEAANRQPADRFLFDDEDRLRVITESMSFGELVERAFGRPRPYLAGDAIASGHLLSVLGRNMLKAPNGEGMGVLLDQARKLLAVVEVTLSDPIALPLLQERLAVLERIGADEDERARFGLEHDWLGGSG